jgi:hypothetical protein
MLRAFLVLSIFGLVALRALGQDAPAFKMDVPVGRMAGDEYRNDALELKFTVPDGWVGSMGASEALAPDSVGSDSAINACSKAIFTIHVAKQRADRFAPVSQLMVIDPGCFPGVKFPDTLSKENWNQPFVQVMAKALSHSPFSSANSADINGFVAIGRQFVTLTGSGEESIADRPVHVNYLVVFVKSNGYWVAWMTRADDKAKKQLEKSSIQFSAP